MKIKVSQLKPNPYRNIDKYPVDPAKVEALKKSIDQTGFWDNLVARTAKPSGKGYELAYGYNRLMALKELGIKEVDIPVKDISDATMIQMMANENMDEWRTSPGAINEAVAAAKQYLDTEISKAKNFNQVNEDIKVLFSSNSQFMQVKDIGVGQTILLKFLGEHWKQWTIQEALDNFKPDLDLEAVEMFPLGARAIEFKKAIRELEVPKEKQKRIARILIEKDVGRDQVYSMVEGIFNPSEHKKQKKQPKPVDKVVAELARALDRMKNRLMSVVSKAEVLDVIQLMDKVTDQLVKDSFMIHATNLIRVLDPKSHVVKLSSPKGRK